VEANVRLRRGPHTAGGVKGPNGQDMPARWQMAMVLLWPRVRPSLRVYGRGCGFGSRNHPRAEVTGGLA